MKFLIDECVWFSVAQWFKNKKFDVICIVEGFSGYSDNQVLEKAYTEQRILVTRDKDFGDIVFRQKKNHCGILLLRFESEFPADKIIALEKFFSDFALSGQLEDSFIVLTNKSIRIIKSEVIN